MKTKRKKRWKIIVKGILLLLVLYLSLGFLSTLPVKKKNMNNPPDFDLLTLSEKFLYAVKTNDSIAYYEQQLADLSMPSLKKGLTNDKAIKTFWINLYNGWFQILAGREKMSRPKIFTGKKILIAGHHFSLDNIEHDILRRYRWKYSMGYLPRFFPGRLLKTLAVQKIDYRIHFALNCGAKSCPLIAFYQYEKLDSQLDVAGRNFLKNETTIDEENKSIRTSKILDWFRADFGGKKGMRKILGHIFHQDFSGYTIHFNPYDWESVLNNYREE